MIKANPLTGVGPGNYATAFTAFQPPGLTDPYYFANCDYLQFTSETGLLLAPLIAWLAWNLFAHGFARLRTRDLRIRGTTVGAMGGILAMLVYSLTDFNLNIPANAFLFTVFAAFVCSSRKPVPGTGRNPSAGAGREASRGMVPLTP
jgi:O-antigen ligase